MKGLYRHLLQGGLAVLCALAVTGCASGDFAPRPLSASDEPPVKRRALRDDGPGQPVRRGQRSQQPLAGGDENLKIIAELPQPAGADGEIRQKIRSSDIIEVTVFGVEKLNRTVEVDGAGNISLPLIGEVVAAGRSERQLERELAARYGKSYLRSPQIGVKVKESAGRRVTVDGEVNRTGLYPVSAQSTLLRAIAEARGLTNIANPSKIYVFRKVKDKTFVANYDVDAIRAGKRHDPRLFGGDVVVVFSSQAKVALENLKSVLGVARSAGSLAVLP